ncbi:sugar transferase [Mobilicoccus massiliensis]|uniref:sugar transferase n=1 Tax=Mobilicoccus massiliensis TaxID=1522310 RepID=UPI00058B0821|nr:sugar transferase [Mobilicoccus massiliensis]
MPGGSTAHGPSIDGDIFSVASRAGSWSQKYLHRLVAFDLLTAFVTVGLALVFGPGRADINSTYIVASLVMPLLWIVALGLSRAYERRYLGVSEEEYRAVGRAVVGLLSLLAIGGLFVKAQWSRLYVITLVVGLFALGLLVRRAMRHWLHRNRREGKLMQRTVVVGRADAAAELIRNIKNSPDQGLDVVAVCTSGLDTDWNTTSAIEGVPVMGTSVDAVSAVDLCDAEVVAVTSHPELAGKGLRRLAWALEERDVELVVSTGLLDVAGPRLSLRQSADMSLLHIERPAATRRSVILKSLMDRTLAAMLVIALSPVFIAIALAIKFTSPGPVLFRQKRVGVGGEFFTIYKFRTMVVDAEKQLTSLLAHNEGNAVQFKMKKDPRITPIGTFLRRFSLDELPQLFNVLIGNMSLVGPRPQSQAEVEQYEPDAMRRLHVRPGMTGLWQISGRSDLDWEQSIRLDLRYVDNWSPIVDLQILFRTFKAVVTSNGAY